MYLWDLSKTPDLNEYKICKYHSIKSGIILYGDEAFVFTPLSNNDMQSYIKILFGERTYPSGFTKSKATRLIVEYIRVNSKNSVIPCIPSIQNSLYHMIGISPTTFADDPYTFSTLLNRIYVFMYMLHYNMPLQRKNTPGKRNLASSVHCRRSKGWYSYLSGKEQKILSNESVFVSSNSIPDDMINGIAINEITNYENITHHDLQNLSMFRDGSMDCMVFQQKVRKHAYEYSQRTAVTINNDKDLKGKIAACVNPLYCLQESHLGHGIAVYIGKKKF